MTRPRKITRRIEDFPHIIAMMALDPSRPNEVLLTRPIMSFQDDDAVPTGYREWCALYKSERRKAGG